VPTSIPCRYPQVLAVTLALLSFALGAPAMAQLAVAEQRIAAAEQPLDEGQMRERLEELAEVYEPLEEAFGLVSELVGPSVVAVASVRVIEGRSPFRGTPFEEFFRDPFFGPFGGEQPPQRAEGLGSGVLINGSGYILTNYHVIAEAEELTVRLHDGREFDAEVVGADEATDLAVIRIEAERLPENLPIATFGDSDALRVGQFVVAIGSPFGLEQTVTSGVVSSKGRALGIARYEDFIQTDTAINRGNSGGPLVNLRGEVVGINTAILSATGGYQGVGLAISSNMARYVAESLIETGRVVRGWLGIEVQTLTPELATTFEYPDTEGALVTNVMVGSPAETAGLMYGDILLAIDGEQITDARDLSMRVARLRPNQDVQFTVWRDERDQRIEVTIGEQPQDMSAAAPSREREAPEPGPAALGLQLADITPEVRQRLQIPQDVRGVAIIGVAPGSPAQTAGLRPGHVILDVAGRVPNDAAEAADTIRERMEDGVRLRVRIGDVTQFVVLRAQ
jgi:serine protease Do